MMPSTAPMTDLTSKSTQGVANVLQERNVLTSIISIIWWDRKLMMCSGLLL